ncbi:cupin-like domain-containing protein [Paraburkholderia phytofirmans]|uniref:cupin-like domain-containing protein n=1 Tax=Paraburkholderia phytofirmans TaxID=261302 RepID=UPI0038BB9CCF
MVSMTAHVELSAVLEARLSEHYVAPPQAVAVDLIVSDCADASRRFTFGRRIEPTSIMSVDVHRAAARITLSRALLSAMLDDPTGFDPRSAAAMEFGGVRIDGAERLAAYWLQLLKRPSAAARMALERARRRAPTVLATVPALQASDCDDQDLHAALADTLDASVPLVLRGMVSWPEVAWTLDDWRTHEGTTVLRTNPSGGLPQTVADFIDGFAAQPLASAGAATYTGGCLLPPAWEARFSSPILPARMFGAGQLWFGRASAAALVTRLHCDLANSFLAQIHGRKRVRLYAPAQEGAVYALDAFNTYRPCRVDVAAPDLTRFPRFADASSVDVMLEPGDLLVIPTGWFHCVWALDHVLSISRFADDESAAALLDGRLSPSNTTSTSNLTRTG